MKLLNRRQLFSNSVHLVFGCLFAVLCYGLFESLPLRVESRYLLIFFFITLMFIGMGISFGLFYLIDTRLENLTSGKIFLGFTFCFLLGIVLTLDVPIQSSTFAPKHTLKIVATGEKNPQSRGSEVWLYSITTRKRVYSSNLQEICRGDWRKKGGALFSSRNQPSALVCELIAADIVKIKFGKHEWSGKVKLTFDQQASEERDLFSIVGSKEYITFPVSPVKSRKLIALNALFTLGSGFWIGLLVYAAIVILSTNPIIKRFPLPYRKIQISLPFLERIGRRIPYWLIGLLSISVYVMILIIPIPIYYLERTRTFFYLIISTLILSITLRKPEKKWFFLSLLIILVFIGYSIISLWSHTRFHYSAIGGLIPRSDAFGYYRDAFSISAGEKVSYSIRANRIMHTTFLAGLLAFTDMNLQATLALIGFLWGIVILFLAIELERSIGYGSGALCAFLCLAFFHICASGTVLSENTGFLLGGIGTALLLNGARRKEFIRVFLGIFLLTLALNARSGAFFVLPLLFIWASLYYSKGFSIKNLILAISSSFGAFGINGLFLTYLSDSTTKSNYFLVILPKLIWAAVARNTPRNIPSLYPDASRTELGNELIQVVLQMIRSDPWMVLNNFFSGYYKGILQPYAPLLFRFMGQIINGSILIKVFYILMYVGLIICLFRVKHRTYSLFLFSFLGIFLSVPLVNYVGYRALASTMPITFCTIAAGAAFLLERLSKLIIKPINNDLYVNSLKDKKNDYPLQMFAVGLIGWMIVIPIIVNIIKPNMITSGYRCNNGIPLIFYPIQGSYIRLIGVRGNSPQRLPDVDIKRIIKSNAFGDGDANLSTQAPELYDEGSILFPNYVNFCREFVLILGNYNIDIKAPIRLNLTDANGLERLSIATPVNHVSEIDSTRKWVFWGISGILLLSYITVGLLIARRRGTDT